MPASLAPWTGTDRGGACEDGGWRTEEEEEDRKAATGDRPGGVLWSASAGGEDGATEWFREEPSWAYACAVCGPLPEEGNMVHRTPEPDDKA